MDGTLVGPRGEWGEILGDDWYEERERIAKEEEERNMTTREEEEGEEKDRIAREDEESERIARKGEEEWEWEGVAKLSCSRVLQSYTQQICCRMVKLEPESSTYHNCAAASL